MPVFLPGILKLATHLPHGRILGYLQCGLIRQKALKIRVFFKDAMSRHDFAERIISIIENQI